MSMIRSSPGKPWMAAVLAVATLCVGTVHASPTPQDLVVFGNLGPNGDGPLTNTNVDSDTLPLAQGFTVGASPALYDLASVTLGLYNEVGGLPTSTTVSLFFSLDPIIPLHTSSAVPVGAKGLYTFSFSGVTLTPGDTYFIVLNNGASWYYAGSGLSTTAATAQNGSDYADAGIFVNPGNTGWQASGAGNFSLSVAVVPEPHEYAMVAGAGMVGFAMWRRRAQRAAKA